MGLEMPPAEERGCGGGRPRLEKYPWPIPEEKLLGVKGSGGGVSADTLSGVGGWGLKGPGLGVGSGPDGEEPRLRLSSLGARMMCRPPR